MGHNQLSGVTAWIYLKGRKPPMAIWMTALLYQGAGGISRAMFLVRQGASNPLAVFLPNIPPSIVRGNPTTDQDTCNKG